MLQAVDMTDFAANICYIQGSEGSTATGEFRKEAVCLTISERDGSQERRGSRHEREKTNNYT